MTRATQPVVDRRVGRVAWLRDYRRDPAAFLQGLAEGHDLIRFRPGSRHIYVVNSPELIRGIVASDQHAVVKGATIRASRELLGEGLLSSEGELHTRQRRRLQPAFHRTAHSRFGQFAVAAADRRQEGWGDGAELDFHLEMRHVTIDVLGRSLFSSDLAGSADDIVAAVGDLQEVARNVGVPGVGLIRRIPTRSNRRLDQALRHLEGVIASVLLARQALVRDGTAPTDDFLALLVAPDAPGGMTQARDEAMTMMTAGHETTAGILAWTGWLLATHPDVQSGVQHELASAVGSRPPVIDDLERLPYLHQVFTEALRLYPPIWAFSRMTTEPYPLNGTTAAAGSVLLMSPYVTQRDSRYFDHPAAFHPERWEGPRPDRFAYFPFGGGPRMCIGEGFALTVGKLVLATLASRWSFQPAGAAPKHEALVTLRPQGGVTLGLQRRGRE